MAWRSNAIPRSETVTASESWDVIVVGGGPAGSIAARALALAGARVVLCERGAYDKYRPGEVLASYVQHQLTSIGLGELCAQVPTRRCDGIVSAWGSNELSTTPAMKSPFGGGLIVDRRDFDRALVEAAASAGVVVRMNASVDKVSRDDNRYCVSVKQGRPLEAPRLVDATGRRAFCATKLRADRVHQDRLIATGRLLRPRSKHLEWKSVLLLESAPGGYWYSVPLAQDTHRAVAVWLADGDAAKRSEDANHWRARLRAAPHTRSRLAGSVSPLAGTFRWDARSALTLESTPGFVAVGDAAMSCDPLAADGVSRAIQSGLDGAAALLETAGIGPLLERRRKAWRTYLQQRGSFYEVERRWPSSLYWSRRAGIDPVPKQLDPAAVLRKASAANARVARAEALIGAANLATLMRCLPPRKTMTAADLVRAAQAPHTPDMLLVRAVEVLIEDGALMSGRVSPSGSRDTSAR